MSGIEIHKEPENAERQFAPLGSTQTYNIGDPVYFSSAQLTEPPQDGTEVLDGEMAGWALEPATGIHAASRTGAANGFGAAQGDIRSYIPANAPGLLLRTQNFWATGAAGTLATPVLADIGSLFQLTCENSTSNWGVEETAATVATDFTVRIVDVLDVDMKSIQDTGNTGVWVVFEGLGSTTQLAGRT